METPVELDLPAVAIQPSPLARETVGHKLWQMVPQVIPRYLWIALVPQQMEELRTRYRVQPSGSI